MMTTYIGRILNGFSDKRRGDTIRHHPEAEHFIRMSEALAASSTTKKRKTGVSKDWR